MKAKAMAILQDIVGLYRINAISQTEKDYLVSVCKNMMQFEQTSYLQIIQTNLESIAKRYPQGTFENQQIQNALQEVYN